MQTELVRAKIWIRPDRDPQHQLTEKLFSVQGADFCVCMCVIDTYSVHTLHMPVLELREIF